MSNKKLIFQICNLLDLPLTIQNLYYTLRNNNFKNALLNYFNPSTEKEMVLC